MRLVRVDVDAEAGAQASVHHSHTEIDGTAEEFIGPRIGAPVMRLAVLLQIPVNMLHVGINMPTALIDCLAAHLGGHGGGTERIVEQDGEQGPTLALGVVELSEAHARNVGNLLFEPSFFLPQGCRDAVYFAQLCQSQRAGNFVHAEVQAQNAPAAHLHTCAHRRVPLVVNSEGRSIELFVARGHQPAVARGNGLEHIERKTRHITDAADLTSFIGGPSRLAGIFNHQQFMFGRDGHDGIHVARVAQHMHRHDGPRLGRNPPLDLGRVNI